MQPAVQVITQVARYVMWATGACAAVLLASCGPGSSPGIDDDSVSLPLSRDPQVVSDGNGNFMALWQSGVSIVARYYDQGNGGQNFVVAPGERPALAMLANGETTVLWHALDRFGGYELRGRQYDSATNSWSAVNNFLNIRQQGNQDIAPDVAAHGDTAIAVWQKWGGADVSQRQLLSMEYVELTNDNYNGPRWPAQLPREIMPTFSSLANSTVSAPRVAIGANRRAMVAWVDRTTANDGLHVGRYNPYPNLSLSTLYGDWNSGGHWRFKAGPQTGLVNQTGFDIAMQSNGDAFVIWQQTNQVFANRYHEASVSWEAIRAIGTVEPTSVPALAIHELGYALVVAQYNGAVSAYHYIPDQWATGWQPRIQINTTGNIEGSPDVAIATDGRALAAWVQNGDVTINTFDGTHWTGPVVVGQGRTPMVAMENGGSCLVVWERDGFIYDYSCNLPTATFTYTPRRPLPGEPINFDASASSDDTGTLTRWEWDFNDDGIFDATGVTTTNTYANEGTYTVRLRVTNNRGFSSSVATQVPVTNGVLLAVNRIGNGRVTSATPGIDCGSDCGETYPLDTVVTLTATPDTGWTFDRWQGDCAAGNPQQNPTLTFTVTGNFSGPAFTCRAEFLALATTATLGVSVRTNGMPVSAGTPVGGRVTSSPAGIDCGPMGSDCSEAFPLNSAVTLTAIPNAGYELAGWNSGGHTPGCGATDGLVTQVVMDLTFECQVSFRSIVGGATRDVTVLYDGRPGQVIDVNTGQLDCTANCTVALPVTQSPIQLRAVNGAASWSTWGNCDRQPADPANPSGPPLCEIDISVMVRTVIVSFL